MTFREAVDDGLGLEPRVVGEIVAVVSFQGRARDCEWNREQRAMWGELFEHAPWGRRSSKRTSRVVPVLPEFASKLLLVLVLVEVLLRELALSSDKLLGLVRIGVVQPVVRVGDGDLVACLG